MNLPAVSAKKAIIGLCSLLLIGGITAFFAWKAGWVTQAFELKNSVLSWCRANPVTLFAAIAILPGFAFPVAPLLILAGVVWGSSLQGCVLALAAVGLNIVWTHLLASGPLRGSIVSVLGPRFQRWQNMPSNDHLRVVCLLRVTPGVPLFVQNYVIGLLGIPLRFSLALALPITGLYICGFVLTGGAIFEGRIGIIILGVSLLLAATILVRFIRERVSPETGSSGI